MDLSLSCSEKACNVSSSNSTENIFYTDWIVNIKLVIAFVQFTSLLADEFRLPFANILWATDPLTAHRPQELHLKANLIKFLPTSIFTDSQCQ